MSKTYKENESCPNCKDGTLILILENEPWYPEHLQCDLCDSTYNL